MIATPDIVAVRLASAELRKVPGGRGGRDGRNFTRHGESLLVCLDRKILF